MGSDRCEASCPDSIGLTEHDWLLYSLYRGLAGCDRRAVLSQIKKNMQNISIYEATKKIKGGPVSKENLIGKLI